MFFRTIQLSGLSIFLHQKPKIFKFLTILTFDDVMVLMTSYESGSYDIFFPDKLSTKTKKNNPKCQK